jgi:heme/copper-type cytochrome/quinol oxidase subunit 1
MQGSTAERGREVGESLKEKILSDPIYLWVTTTNHKRIGLMYIYTAFIFFLLGGIEVLIMRTQLAVPNNKLVDPGRYDELFTMHGTVMIFAFMMPVFVGLGNYLVPLMIGARDMAFPRLNAASYWLFVLGCISLATSLLLGIAPDTGWFGYAPLTEANPGCFTSGTYITPRKKEIYTYREGFLLSTVSTVEL